MGARQILEESSSDFNHESHSRAPFCYRKLKLELLSSKHALVLIIAAVRETQIFLSSIKTHVIAITK